MFIHSVMGNYFLFVLSHITRGGKLGIHPNPHVFNNKNILCI